MTRQPGTVALLVAGSVVLKFAVLLALGRLFRLERRPALLFAFALAQGGEFAFVLFSLAQTSGVLPAEIVKLLVAPVASRTSSAPLVGPFFACAAAEWIVNHRPPAIYDSPTRIHASPSRMLKPHEIFTRMSPVVAAQLLGLLQEKETPLYKATIETLTKARKLRPIFIERRPREERYHWLQANIGKPMHDGVAAHLLQIWLVSAQSKLLCDFLDALGIAHDENGTVEALPSSPPKAELASAIETLLAKHDPAVVAVYLHAFQAMDDKGWEPLAELLAEDPRLKL